MRYALIALLYPLGAAGRRAGAQVSREAWSRERLEWAVRSTANDDRLKNGK